ncbi:hypothetical protein ACTXT7_017571 [Hymenolepis weldensis]
MYGDDSKKCQSGCKYPKTDIVASQENFTGSNVSIIPLSAEKCFLQPTGPTPINQDLNMAESLDPNCKQPFKTTNSAIEFETELFQTDIRELSQELPEHADDPNHVQDDTHGFLPEHAIASRKVRDKRKRKTPKSTAVNQPGNPKHHLLLWRITRRKYQLNHNNPLPVPKLYNFTRKSRLRGSILQKRSPSTCQPLHNPHRRLINFKPPTINCSTQCYQKQHSRANITLAIYLQSIISQNPAWNRHQKKRLRMHEKLNPEIKQPNRHRLLWTTNCFNALGGEYCGVHKANKAD